MVWRPQFAFPPAPAGFRDEQFHYGFDGSNVPALATAIAAGSQVLNVVLQLQNDAEFILRAIKVQLGTAPSSLALQLRDPYGNYLSATPLELSNYLTGGGAAMVGQMAVPFEDQIRCPLGGFFEVFLYNLTTGSVAPPAFTFFGVNRRECGRMAA